MAMTRTEIQKRYDAKHRKTITINLSLENDKDIIEQLEQVESMQGYIKQAIRHYIKTAGKDV